MKTFTLAVLLLGGLAVVPAAIPATARTLDHVALGTEAEGTAHRLRITDGGRVVGALGQSSLQLRPTGRWRGGTVDMRLTVNPAAVNFVTLRLWGGEKIDGNLTLLCDGKQVGDRLLSDYDQLDYGAKAQQFPGAFYYRTYRLPDAVTRRRSAVDCTIEASGPIFSYSETFDRFQQVMTTPSRGLYDLYVHDDPWLDTRPGTSDGALARPSPRPGSGRIARGAPGSDVLGRIKARLERDVQSLLRASRPLGQHEILFLARFRLKRWSPLARDPRILAAIVKGMDDFAAVYVKDPTVVRFEKSTWNPDWFGFGPIGQAIALDPAALAPVLDKSIAWRNGTTATRRTAYAEMLVASREWLRVHRRFYTNQSMIVDCYGIYLANRGVAALDPKQAMPEQAARRYLYEATGIEEWRGDDLPDGGHSYDAGGPDGTKAQPYRVAHGYHLVTRGGLTRELGYVGNYGEVLDWVGLIYDATRPTPDTPGDPKLRDQLARIARARAPFRYPASDADGFRAMRMMADIGWRDLKAPGDVTYVQEPRAGAASPIEAAVLTEDPLLVGYAQQMVEDNQLWPSLERSLAQTGFRQTYGLLNVIDEVAALAGMAPQPARLPMSDGQPDMAVADPEDGVIAIKRGDERFYASLYWRANRGVTNLGRVWLSGPRGNRIATVPVDTGFTPSGQRWTRPDKLVLLKNDVINRGYGLHLAEAGEALPLAEPPSGVVVKPGEDSVYAGRGDSYVMRYGGYTVAINMSETKPFAFLVPKHGGNELISGRTMPAGRTIRMAPLSAVAFYDER